MSDKQKTEPTKAAKIFAGIFTGVILLFIVIGIAGNDGGVKQDMSNTKATSPKTAQPAKAEVKKPSVPPEYTSALIKATQYANTQNMSKQGVYDQLTSEYGEQFSKKAAQYAIDNVKADWNANALAKAKQYQSEQHMSPAAIHDQLTSSYGEKFTEAQADYAIAHLNS